jgi:hypothetical protein
MAKVQKITPILTKTRETYPLLTFWGLVSHLLILLRTNYDEKKQQPGSHLETRGNVSMATLKFQITDEIRE